MSIIDQYITDIGKLCGAHKVRRLFTFGSVLTPNFNKSSDLDFIVDFESMDISKYADNYYDLKFSLEDIFKKPVDLLEEKAIKNPYFLEVVNKNRRLIYGH